jgi:hypothetical protein
MILHCFLHDDMTLKLSFVLEKENNIHRNIHCCFDWYLSLWFFILFDQVLAVIDLSLSSDIALSFAFNGLVDLGILGETRRSFAVQLFKNFIW